LISIQGVSHWFGEKQVLKGISIDIPQGEVLAIMGSSGGGKTTLLKCISGLITPREGDVLVDGISVRQEPEKARSRMGLVFQYAALFDYMTVEQNITFGIERKRKLSRKEKKEITSRLLEEVNLAGTEHLMPSELSGGMRKRVGLARALALEPKVVLYDEPTSGLDPVTAYAIDELILETRAHTQATSLVVSHDVNSVLRVADRIAFLHQGALIFLGTPREFRSASEEAIRDLVGKARAESFSGTS
jgi:phospholipid/cholesterol/gamma-HCH transport system ATP-binding protein